MSFDHDENMVFFNAQKGENHERNYFEANRDSDGKAGR